MSWSETIVDMGKLARAGYFVGKTCRRVSLLAKEAFLNALKTLGWISYSSWNWVAIVFIVTTFWTLGGNITSIAVAEPIPSELELATAALLFSTGTILLAARICVAAWKTNELDSVAQRVTITLFVGVIATSSVIAGSRYLMKKAPLLLIESKLIEPAPPRVPSEPSTPANPIPVSNNPRADVTLVNIKPTYYDLQSGKRILLDPNHLLSVDVTYQVKGEARAEKYFSLKGAWILPDISLPVLRKKARQLLASPSDDPNRASISVDSGTSVWFTAQSANPLTSGDIDEIRRGNLYAVVMWAVFYSDPHGPQHRYQCLVLQRPSSPDPYEEPTFQMRDCF